MLYLCVLSLLLRLLRLLVFFFIIFRPPPRPPLFPYTTLFRSGWRAGPGHFAHGRRRPRSSGSHLSVRQRGEIHSIEAGARSEEHTSELQSPCNLVCRLLLEKKKQDEAT